MSDHRDQINHRAEQDALACLRIGGSFEDAAKLSGLSLQNVIRLWAMRAAVTQPLA